MKILKQIYVSLLFFLPLLIFINCGTARHGFSEQKALVFSTWEGFEADKCAPIWLIKRFIDRNAVIKFFPKGEIIKEGIPFETPDAKFRRYHNMSAFESLLKRHNLQDPKLIYIGKIIHDIEVNIWEKKVFPETSRIQMEINDIIRDTTSNDGVIEKSGKYFDLFYKEIELKAGGLPKE